MCFLEFEFEFAERLGALLHFEYSIGREYSTYSALAEERPLVLVPEPRGRGRAMRADRAGLTCVLYEYLLESTLACSINLF